MKKISNVGLENLLQQTINKKYQSSIKRGKALGVIYTRVSSKEQAENNGSLELQIKYCREFGEKHGIVIQHEFGGIYESAKTDGRKEFQRMLSFVKKNPDITYIIVHNYDRFSRTGGAAMQLTANLRKEGIMVKSVTQDI